MTHSIEHIALSPSSPGTERILTVHRFGTPGARPKACFQAALHANETPGLLIAHHLLRQLIEADREGRIMGEVVVVPVANPIGLSDTVLGNQIGREALDGSGNYNRGWPHFAAAVADSIRGCLGPDAAANVAIIRETLREQVGRMPRVTEFQSLHAALLSLAIDADLVIDSHCELAAVLEFVVAPWSWPLLQGLAADLDPGLVHVTDEPHLFETACSRPWHDLAALFPDVPIPQALVSVTLEMRGATDVSDAMAAQDAAAVLRQFQRIGALAGPLVESAPWQGRATPHQAIAMIRTPVGGVIVYPHPIGTLVEAGAVVAEIVDPAATDPCAARTPIRTERPGMVYATILNRLVRPNDIVVKVAAVDFGD